MTHLIEMSTAERHLSERWLSGSTWPFG